MPTRTEAAEQTVRELLDAAGPGTRVGSIASISAATGLSTGVAAEVMKRFITQGLVTSTRGPNGGYWRTSTPLPDTDNELAEEARAIGHDLTRLAERLAILANKLNTP